MLHSITRPHSASLAPDPFAAPPLHWGRGMLEAVQGIFYELTDPFAMATMVIGGGVFQGAGLGLRAGFLTRGLSARCLAPIVGMAAEAPAMVLASRGLRRAFQKDFKETQSIGEEIITTALAMGPLRVFGMGGAWLARSAGYARGTLHHLLTQGGLFTGILAGQWGQRHYLRLPTTDPFSSLAEGVKLFAQFHLGGYLLPHPFEKFFGIWEQRLRLQEQGTAPTQGMEWGLYQPAYNGPTLLKSPPAQLWQETQNVAMSAEAGNGSSPSHRPKIAIIGGGMAGIMAARTLRKAASPPFHPEITLLEGASILGGKVAPNNMGAQFLDAEGFEPVLEMVQEHGLETRWRGDYDAAIFELATHPRSPKLMGEDQFLRALQKLREAAVQQLQTQSARELDKRGVVDLIKQLRRQHRLSADEQEAMLTRLALEEGSFNISLLSFAANLAKSKTPMPRIDVVGGLHRVIEAEGRALQNWGAQVLTQTPVKKVNVLQEGIEIFFRQDKKMQRAMFDAAILAVSPEHLGAIAVTGSQIPFSRLSELELARITKTNVVIRGQAPGEEIANNRFAKWFSPHEDPQLSIVTFFHGWQNRRRLSRKQILRETFGLEGPGRLISLETRIWDGRKKTDGIVQGYTTMPAPGQARWVFELIEDLYFRGRYDSERLSAANHLLGAGCYVRDAALSGELVALTSMRQLGFGTGPDPAHYYARLFGINPHTLRRNLLTVLRQRAEALHI